MLHDLQESQASRAALVSAWRDYGPQVSTCVRTRAWCSRHVSMAHSKVSARYDSSSPTRLAGVQTPRHTSQVRLEAHPLRRLTVRLASVRQHYQSQATMELYLCQTS